MTIAEVQTGLRATIQASIQADVQLLVELQEVDLRWRAAGMSGYRPLTSWIELDLLLMGLGPRYAASGYSTGDGFEYLIVESLARNRFVQTMGDPRALIIEVCGSASTPHPDVWRLRRAPGDRLPHAELGATLFDGGMDADSLFTVEEAARVFREWLRGGSVAGVGLDAVVY